MATLLLIPTRGEAAWLLRCAPELGRRARLEICGFGPVLAAARAAQLLAGGGIERAVLAGIAGTYDGQQHPIGNVVVPGRVALDGIGAGEGDDALSAEDLGFPYLEAGGGLPLVSGLLDLASGDGPLLLTVCSSTASDEQLFRRRALFPDAGLEDMEGYGVAVACRLAAVPLLILRGVSNVAGDRDRSRWEIEGALAAVAARIEEILPTAR